MKLIGHDDILALNLNPADFPNWVDDALTHKEETHLPAKLSIHLPGDRFFNTMPVALPFLGVGGVKMVNRYPQREPALDSQIIVFDLDSGAPLALMDGNYITNWRTGAVAVHSAELLATPNFTTVAFIGLGNTARATAKILASRYPGRQFTFNLTKYKDQHELFAETLADFANVTCRNFDSFTDSVADASVVFSAVTVFHEDVCEPAAFGPGTTLIPIHTRGFMACDLVFDKVFGDDYDQISPFKYFDQFPSFAEVAEVVRGEKPGRVNERERILVYNIGIASHDIYFARKIIDQLPDSLPSVELTSPSAKFWC